MKNFIKILIFSLFAINAYAQQATEIDSKSVRLPRYANLAAITNITTGITTPTQGMMVYNIETASNWYYNGTAWTNTLGAVSAPLNLIYSTTPAESFGLDQTISGERILNGDPLNPTLSPAYGVKGSVSGVGYGGAGVYGIGIGQNSGVYGTSELSYGLYGNSSESIGVHGSSTSGVGGYFRAGSIGSYPSNAALVGYSSLNDYKAIYGLMTGLGRAGLFEINNTGSSNPALEGITNGAGNGVRGISFNGVAGLFSSTNYFTLGGNAALIGHSDTDGYKSIYGISEGNNGQAGVFIINNGTNTNAALESSTNGTGKAAYFHGTNALETDGAIKFGGSGVGIIEAGKVLTSDALGNATWQNIVPYSKTLNESGDLLRLTNTGTGGAGFFRINFSSNSNNAVHAATYGSGSAIYGIAENDNGYAATFESENSFPTLNSTNYENGNAGKFEINNINSTGHTLLVNTNGLGRGGWFQSTNPLNNAASIISENHGSGQAIYGTNLGTGKAGVFEINNGSNSSFALHAFTNGTGKAAYFQGTNALETNGTIKFGGAGVGTISAGKVLTSDAVGNATWQDVPAVVAPLNLTHTVTPFQSTATGTTGNAGSFQITNASNSANALTSNTSGTGKAAYFQGTNALETDGTIKFGGSGVGTIAAGKILTSDAVGNATWQAIPAVVAPLYLTHTVTPFQSNATGATGNAGSFQITNASNSANALSSTTSGSGKAAYFQGTNALETDGTIKFGGSGVGTIAAGKVLTATDAFGNATWSVIPAVTAPLNLTSTATTLQSIATGASGFAGDFQITNASNAANALSSTTTGTGKAAYFQGTNALETNGTIKFGGAGVGTITAGKVLTSDAVGNATWQAIPEVTGPLTLTSTTTTLSSTATGTVGNASNFNISNVSNPSNGISVSTSGTGKAIAATNNSSINPTITAVNNTNLGNALDITGGIKVSGTNKAAFKITTITGGGGNTSLNILTIPNTTLANNANDILIVTHNYSPNNTYLNKAFGVYWTSTNWAIYLEDPLSIMPNNITFNVLVIKQ